MMTKKEAKNIKWYSEGDYPYDYDYVLLKDFNKKIDEIYLEFEKTLNNQKEEILRKLLLELKDNNTSNHKQNLSTSLSFTFGEDLYQKIKDEIY